MPAEIKHIAISTDNYAHPPPPVPGAILGG